MGGTPDRGVGGENEAFEETGTTEAFSTDELFSDRNSSGPRSGDGAKSAASSALDAPSTLTGSSGGRATLLTSSVITSPNEALLLQELQRMRLFTVFSAAMAVVLCVLTPALNADALATKIHFGAAVQTVAVNLVLRIVLRNDGAYRPWMALIAGLSASITAISGFYVWGVVSALCLVIPIGVFFFALNESLLNAIIIYLAVAGGHAALWILQIAGVVPDASLVRPLTKTLFSEIAMLIALQLAFLGAFAMARALRRASLRTLHQLDKAVRGMAQRQALLSEAGAELARVARVGHPGRFSEQNIGSYCLGVILGRGAMGDVYEATHLSSGAAAAVKLLNASAMQNKDLVRRFYREVDIAGSLQAPTIVRVLEHSDENAPVPYLVMERLSGATLAARLRKLGPMSTKDALPLLKSLAVGIDAAHAKGIIHRDLKPHNIFGHREDGHLHWKILDFGIAKLTSDDDTLTQGKLVGTPSYMSPEQALGDSVDHRADLYSIGVLLYRALTGQPAFTGPSIPVVMQRVAQTMPRRPSSLIKISADFDSVLSIAMAKRPADRFDSAGEMYLAFKAADEKTLSSQLRTRSQAILAKTPWA